MQPVPEGYKPLGFAGFTDKGGYSESEVYAENDIVHKDNTAWRCLVNGTTGITPAEGENWTVFIASESDSSGITTTDTQGIVGIAGQKVSNQDIIDELAERASNQKENQFGTIDTFPVPGEPGIFYTDTETNLIYRWDAGSEEYVQVGGSESKAEDMISDAFSTSKAYAIGDYAIYENTLYKFTSAKSAGAWDTAKVQAVTVAGELNSLSEDLASANTQIDELNVNISYTRSEALNNIIPEKVTLSTNNNNRYYLNGNVCTILYDFEVTYVVTSNERIFNNIPTPWADNVWVTLSKDSFTDNTGEDASVMLVRSGSESFLAVAWRELKVGRYIGSIVYQTNITG